jgi:hypothetical protein
MSATARITYLTVAAVLLAVTAALVVLAARYGAHFAAMHYHGRVHTAAMHFHARMHYHG